jgi:hypothetical protein
MLRHKANIRCGRKHYLFEIRHTRAGKSYLEMKEYHLNGLSPMTHQTIYIFPEHAAKFGTVLNMMLSSLEQQEKAAPTFNM